METSAKENKSLDASARFSPSLNSMNTVSKVNIVLRESINNAPLVNNRDTFLQEDTTPITPTNLISVGNMNTCANYDAALHRSVDFATSDANKDTFGEDTPAHGSHWRVNCTADSVMKALRAAERLPENRITFSTRYIVNHFTEQGVPIEAPIKEPGKPSQARRSMWNRELPSEPAGYTHFAADQGIQLREALEMDPSTLKHPRQSMIGGALISDYEPSQLAIKGQVADESVPTMPSFKRSSTENGIVRRISTTVRNISERGSQIIKDLDEKAEIHADFSCGYVDPYMPYKEKPITTMAVTSFDDKPTRDNSIRRKISDTMRNISERGSQILKDLDDKAEKYTQFTDGYDNPYTYPFRERRVTQDFDGNAAARAQFSFESPDRQSGGEHNNAGPVIKRHDKSPTDSSVGSRVSSTLRHLAELGSQVIRDLDEKALIHARLDTDSPIPLEPQPNPFGKWLKTIQRRGGHRKTASFDMTGRGSEGGLFEASAITESKKDHRKSLSGSSFGFVSNVKSVGTSLASFSIAPRSRTGISSRHQRTDFSSKASYAGRASEDNAHMARGIILDKDVLRRMEQRQGVIEEILSTEKDYLEDIRALIRVFDGFLITVSILSESLRKSIVLTLKDILAHNTELYSALVTVVANTSKSAVLTLTNLHSHPPVRGHKRWQSLGEAPASEPTASQDRQIGDPKVAGEIAKVFCGKIPGLFLYESYGIMHKEVMKQINTGYRTSDDWRDLNQAIRSTEEMIASVHERESGSRKARTFEDYFIKPIHRIARYEVLFGRLLQQSPVCDCPESSTDVENTLFRIKELHKAMNCTTGNHQKATAMSRTWALQDRLIFASQPESRSRDKVRSFEQNHLCGVLYACWQTNDTIPGRSITGKYLIALLYEKFFVLAQVSGKHDEAYAIQACIPISELHVEDADNGKGLQCHSAPYSWKIVFEHNSQLFEIIMSACSAKEELEWKSRLIDRSAKPYVITVQQEMIASLSLDIKPFTTVYGKPRGIKRRSSIHRATTITGQSTIPRTIIVRGTSATTESTLSSSASQLSMNRSQSLAGPHRPTTLAPTRAERVYLESVLVDVWTRDIIPYPGMCLKPHKEHAVRASASSMMRKISHASISSITKRSSSMASLHKSGEDHGATELDSLRPMHLNRQGRQHSSESTSLPDVEHAVSQDTSGRHSSRLAVIIDEKESSTGTAGAHSTTGSPITTRLTSFRSKKSVGSLVDTMNTRRSTPSTSPSAKSSLALPIVTQTAIHGEELRKENVLQSASDTDRSGSGGSEDVADDSLQVQSRKGKNRAMLMEGFKNLFR